MGVQRRVLLGVAHQAFALTRCAAALEGDATTAMNRTYPLSITRAATSSAKASQRRCRDGQTEGLSEEEVLGVRAQDPNASGGKLTLHGDVFWFDERLDGMDD